MYIHIYISCISSLNGTPLRYTDGELPDVTQLTEFCLSVINSLIMATKSDPLFPSTITKSNLLPSCTFQSNVLLFSSDSTPNLPLVCHVIVFTSNMLQVLFSSFKPDVSRGSNRSEKPNVSTHRLLLKTNTTDFCLSVMNYWWILNLHHWHHQPSVNFKQINFIINKFHCHSFKQCDFVSVIFCFFLNFCHYYSFVIWMCSHVMCFILDCFLSYTLMVLIPSFFHYVS